MLIWGNNKIFCSNQLHFSGFKKQLIINTSSQENPQIEKLMFVACRRSAERISDLSESTNKKPLLLLNKHVSRQFPCLYEKGGTELNWSIEERVPGYNKVETIVINERLLFAVILFRYSSRRDIRYTSFVYLLHSNTIIPLER